MLPWHSLAVVLASLLVASHATHAQEREATESALEWLLAQEEVEQRAREALRAHDGVLRLLRESAVDASFEVTHTTLTRLDVVREPGADGGHARSRTRFTELPPAARPASRFRLELASSGRDRYLSITPTGIHPSDEERGEEFASRREYLLIFPRESMTIDHQERMAVRNRRTLAEDAAPVSVPDPLHGPSLAVLSDHRWIDDVLRPYEDLEDAPASEDFVATERRVVVEEGSITLTERLASSRYGSEDRPFEVVRAITFEERVGWLPVSADFMIGRIPGRRWSFEWLENGGNDTLEIAGRQLRAVDVVRRTVQTEPERRVFDMVELSYRVMELSLHAQRPDPLEVTIPENYEVHELEPLPEARGVSGQPGGVARTPDN